MPPPPFIYVNGYYSSSCGYCKHRIKTTEEDKRAEEESPRENFGAELFNIPADVYDSLLQYNWRRCGSFYYRPRNENMCCPQYAIRVDARNFEVKDQKHKRVLKRMARFLRTGSVEVQVEAKERVDKQEKNNADRIQAELAPLTDALRSAVQEMISTAFIPPIPELRLEDIQFMKQRIGKKSPKFQFLTSHSNFAASHVVMKMFGLLKKHAVSVGNLTPSAVAERMVAILQRTISSSDVVEIAASPNGFLSVLLSVESILSKGRSGDEMDVDRGAFDAENGKYQLFLAASPSTFRQDEYELYSAYQQRIHLDPPEKITDSGYENFLVESSLQSTSSDEFQIHVDMNRFENGGSLTFVPSIRWPAFQKQSYHIRYELRARDGSDSSILLGVSVIDVLPSGLSSVYFFYNPEYGFLSPGVFSALIELSMIKSMQNSSVVYYYLGFYIHNCSKMRYKGQFEPSELLCPVSLRWTPLDSRLRELLDERKYTRFSLDSTSAHQESENFGIESLNFLVGRNQLVKGDVLARFCDLSPNYLDRLRGLFQMAPKSVCENVTYITTSSDISKK